MVEATQELYKKLTTTKLTLTTTKLTLTTRIIELAFTIGIESSEWYQLHKYNKSNKVIVLIDDAYRQVFIIASYWIVIWEG